MSEREWCIHMTEPGYCDLDRQHCHTCHTADPPWAICMYWSAVRPVRPVYLDKTERLVALLREAAALTTVPRERHILMGGGAPHTETWDVCPWCGMPQHPPASGMKGDRIAHEPDCLKECIRREVGDG